MCVCVCVCVCVWNKYGKAADIHKSMVEYVGLWDAHETQ